MTKKSATLATRGSGRLCFFALLGALAGLPPLDLFPLFFPLDPTGPVFADIPPWHLAPLSALPLLMVHGSTRSPPVTPGVTPGVSPAVSPAVTSAVTPPTRSARSPLPCFNGAAGDALPNIAKTEGCCSETRRTGATT